MPFLYLYPHCISHICLLYKVFTLDKAYWTSAGFYGISFNEGKQTLSFKTMHFGIFGLSAFRFSNLPFQSWELRPDTATRSGVDTMNDDYDDDEHDEC